MHHIRSIDEERVLDVIAQRLKLDAIFTEFIACGGSAMPMRRPLIEQITNPQYPPELVRRSCVRLNRLVDQLEQTLPEGHS